MNAAGCFFMPPLFILPRKRIEFLSVPSYAGTAETSHRPSGTASEKSQLVINKKRYERKQKTMLSCEGIVCPCQ
jgi:hypothetical protein